MHLKGRLLALAHHTNQRAQQGENHRNDVSASGLRSYVLYNFIQIIWLNPGVELTSSWLSPKPEVIKAFGRCCVIKKGEATPWLMHMLVTVPLGLESRYSIIMSPVCSFTSHFIHSKKGEHHVSQVVLRNKSGNVHKVVISIVPGKSKHSANFTYYPELRLI